MPIAVFDIDETLVTGHTERLFVRWLAGRGLLGPRQLRSFAGFCAGGLLTHGRHVFARNKAYLDGLGVQRVEDEAEAFVASEIQARFVTACVERLQAHREAGDDIVLLSGTLFPIAAAIGDRLGVSRVIATRCSTRNGHFLAAPPLAHPFGASKRLLLDALRRYARRGQEPAWGYADSIHDVPLLEGVEHPVCVRPDRRLRALGSARGWEVLGTAGSAEGLPAAR